MSRRLISTSGTIKWAFFICALVAVALYHSRGWFYEFSRKPDFDSYYCGAKVVLAGRDPYLVEPLRTCEASIGRPTAPSSGQINAFMVVPTPLPGYVLGILVLLAELPYKVATIAFGLGCLASAVVVAFCLSRLSPLPFLPAIGICYFALDYTPMGPMGAMAPIAICFIAIAAMLARDGRLTLAILALGAAMIQPQIAAFSMIAAFFFFERHRVVVALTAFTLLGLSLVTLGIRGNLEYLNLLRVHTAAEVFAYHQLSLAGLLSWVGVKPSVALTCGTVWSMAMLVTAIVALKSVTRTVKETNIRNVLVVVVPTAFAAFGGTFIHPTQVVVSILPAFFFIRPQGRWWILSALALGVLVFPFGGLVETQGGFSMIAPFGLALTCLWLCIYYLSDIHQARQHASTIVAICAVTMLLFIAGRPAYHEVNVVSLGIQGSELSSVAWTTYWSAQRIVNASAQVHLYYFLFRLPMWFSLLAVLIYTAGAACRLRNTTGGPLALTGKP